MTKPLRVLIVEDQEDDALLLLRELRRGGYEPTYERVDTPEAMSKALEKKTWDIIISDYVMPRFSGIDALKLLQKKGIDLPFIIVSGKIGEDIAVAAMKAGAHGYIMKGNLSRIVPDVERELRDAVVRAEQRRVEAELKHTLNALAHSNAELEQFVHLASCDLERPLQKVADSLQSIEQRFKGCDKDTDKSIACAIEGTTRMQKRINDLLAYSRVATHFEKTDCSFILKRALANLKLVIEKSGAVVKSDSLPAVMADEIQLVQLFHNLIDNAIKFHGDKPPVVRITAEQKENEWVFSIKDNGIGIDPKYHDSIFLISQRIHGKPTGMSLGICKKIVERHGGRIWVESQPSQGSTFYFTLPGG